MACTLLEAEAEACTLLEEVVEARLPQLGVVEVCLKQEVHSQLEAAEQGRLEVLVEEAEQLRSVSAQACLPLEAVCMLLAVVAAAPHQPDQVQEAPHSFLVEALR